jgi:hypothetical protein
MRWIHIASVVTLLGGFIYARFVLAPAAPDAGEAAARGFRPLLYTVLVTLIGSGMYNYATKATYPPGYHMWIGIKLLLVLHIAAASILYSVRAADAAKRNRTALGIVISGLIVIAISNYLRYLSLK